MTDTATARQATPRFRLIREIIAELKKVNWLNRREVIHLTIMVLIVTVVVGALLGVIDYGFSSLIHLFTGR